MSSSSPSSKLVPSLLISLGTVPVLAVVVGSKLLASTLTELGEAWEEVFRGDRLPVLNIPSREEAEDRLPQENK